MRKSCSKLWNENCLLQIVEYEIFAADGGMTPFSANCGMSKFCCKLWNETFLATNFLIRSFCCELWTEKFLLRIVESKLSAVNCGMRCCCCKL